jgi:hypothetical protein
MKKVRLFETYLNEKISNSDILDLVDHIQSLIQKIKAENSSRGAKLFTVAGPLVKELHSLTESKIDEKKSDYQVYHNLYSSAINAALEYAENNGYTYDKEETFTKIGMGDKKPKDGVTNKFTITLYKDGKEQKKALQIQVYGMGNRYELNTYIS